MDKIHDVLILGGGPGGYTAALYCARAGLDTLVVEKLSAGGQMALTQQIDNYPGFEEGIDGFTLGERMQQGGRTLRRPHPAGRGPFGGTDRPGQKNPHQRGHAAGPGGHPGYRGRGPAFGP